MTEIEIWCKLVVDAVGGQGSRRQCHDSLHEGLRGSAQLVYEQHGQHGGGEERPERGTHSTQNKQLGIRFVGEINVVFDYIGSQATTNVTLQMSYVNIKHITITQHQ